MPKTERMSVKEAIKLVESSGFILSRQSGSHAQYFKNGLRITIPIHNNDILHPKITKQILLAIEESNK